MNTEHMNAVQDVVIITTWIILCVNVMKITLSTFIRCDLIMLHCLSVEAV